MLLSAVFMLAVHGQAYPNSTVYNPKSGWPCQRARMASKVNLLQVAIPLRDRNFAVGVHKPFARINHFCEADGDAFNRSLGLRQGSI
jgi:hypothetical protein